MNEGIDKIKLEILYSCNFALIIFVRVVLNGSVDRYFILYASTKFLAFVRFVLVIHSFNKLGYSFY